MKDVCDVIDSS